MFSVIVTVVALSAFVKGQFTIDNCPFECTCTNTDTICTSESMFPTGIPASTIYFELRDSNIREMPHSSFETLRQLQRIKIVSSNITKLLACSFSNQQDLVYIEIANSTIRSIDGNAFSHLRNITRIVFNESKFDRIHSYAFHNVEGVSNFLFERNEIGTIESHAFMNVSRTANFEIMYNAIRSIKSGVIRSMHGVTNFNFIGNNITSMLCGQHDALLESNSTVQVFNNTFNCSCTLAWIFSLNETNIKTIYFKEQNFCKATQERELIQLSRLQFSSVCGGNKSDAKCQMQSPLLPYKDCMTEFDKPLNPVDKVEYPNKDQKRSGQMSVVVTVIQMLIIVVPAFVLSSSYACVAFS